jgi:hypothetical protein
MSNIPDKDGPGNFNPGDTAAAVRASCIKTITDPEIRAHVAAAFKTDPRVAAHLRAPETATTRDRKAVAKAERRSRSRAAADRRQPHHKRSRRRDYDAQAELRFIAKLQRRVYENTGNWIQPRSWSRATFLKTQNALADNSGRAIAYYVRTHPDKIVAAAARRAALLPGPNGVCRYAWTDYRARSIAALGLAMGRTAVETNRRGKWSRIMRGFPVGAFSALLRNPYTGEKPHPKTLTGRWREADPEKGQVGYLRALEWAGLFYSQQLPKDAVEPFEAAGASGHSVNRYWILTDEPLDPEISDADRFRLLEMHGWALKCQNSRENGVAVPNWAPARPEWSGAGPPAPS